jgi:hypothetical protein
LGSTLGDWIDAYACYVDAEALWALTRQWHPEGKNEAVDIFLAELRNSLDELAEVLAEEEPDLDMQNDDEEVADVGARMEDLNLNLEDRRHSSRQPLPAPPTMEFDNCKYVTGNTHLCAYVLHKKRLNSQSRPATCAVISGGSFFKPRSRSTTYATISAGPRI